MSEERVLIKVEKEGIFDVLPAGPSADMSFNMGDAQLVTYDLGIRESIYEVFSFLRWLSMQGSHEYNIKENIGKFVRLTFKIEEIIRPGYFIESVSKLTGKPTFLFVGDAENETALSVSVNRFPPPNYKYYKLDAEGNKEYVDVTHLVKKEEDEKEEEVIDED